MKQDSTLLQLQQKGHRISRAREAIIDIFSSTTKPLTAIDVLQTLEKVGISVNKTTVYRELEFLLSQQLLQTVQLESGIVHYESAKQDHHHHLVCTRCKQIETVTPVELERGMGQLTQRIQQTNRFAIINHSLEFFGTCANCQ